jgi:PilZ domain
MSHCEPVNDNAPSRPHERRANERHRVLLTGKIVLPHNSFSADCTIRDLSANGARVAVSAEAMFPDPFLIVVKDAVVHRSTTAWRSGGQAGLRFEETVSLIQAPPPHLQRARQIWAELMPR